VRTVLVIGVGAGDPDQITIQAIKAINRADVVFVVDKAPEELVTARRAIIDRWAERPPKVVTLEDPPRDRAAPAYREAVEDWRRRRADVWEAALGAHDGTAAFLVWGDPALYDSTIAVLDDVRARGNLCFDHEVIPGISSAQALAARHRIPWAAVGGGVEITTGRRLSPDTGDAIVMLDARCAFTAFPDREIFWGAYVGTEDEILVAGRVRDVAGEIARRRAEARDRKGWVMDAYLLRTGDSRETPRRPGRDR
jgi:precorrin-6A synthase